MPSFDALLRQGCSEDHLDVGRIRPCPLKLSRYGELYSTARVRDALLYRGLREPSRNVVLSAFDVDGFRLRGGDADDVRTAVSH